MKILLTLCMLIPSILIAQNSTKVTYKKNNKEEITFINSNSLFYAEDVSSTNHFYIDFSQKQVLSTYIDKQNKFLSVKDFNDLTKPVNQETDETILGFKCKKVTYNYFSNHVEVWYTEEAKVAGSPLSSFLPSENALVLKLLINKSRPYEVIKIEENTESIPKPNFNQFKKVTSAELEEYKINSRSTKINVFNQDTLHINKAFKQETSFSLNTTYPFKRGTMLLKKIKIPQALLDSTKSIFATLTCASNGDAYDRTGSLFILSDTSIINSYINNDYSNLPAYLDNKNKKHIGIVSTDTYQTPIELIRFFTSFGAGYFNTMRPINNYDWSQKSTYVQEVSDLIPTKEQEIWIGVTVGTYDTGGHIVNLDLKFHPAYSANEARSPKTIKPLFAAEVGGIGRAPFFGHDTLKVSFKEDKELNQNAKLIFTPTGHGGWGGGDEFNAKKIQVRLDGEIIFNQYPWRTDCAVYRELNPASGNFKNGLSSSDLSRSNWCPGTHTVPYFIPLPDLKKGQHQLTITIDQGKPSKNSSSHWALSGVIVSEE